MTLNWSRLFNSVSFKVNKRQYHRVKNCKNYHSMRIFSSKLKLEKEEEENKFTGTVNKFELIKNKKNTETGKKKNLFF